MDEDLRDHMDDEGGGESGGKKGLPMIVIIIIVALVVGAGGFFAGKLFFGGEKEESKKTEEKKDDKKEDKEEKKSEDKKEEDTGENKEEEKEPVPEIKSKSKSGLLTLDSFTVNLNDPFGRRYAEVLMNLEIENKEWVTKISSSELVTPKLRDEIFMIISSKSYNELKSTSGKVTLKEEILMRVNEVLKEEFDVEPVTGVYFSKFLIQ
ncbi:MAG: flagellar basal body-associated FliL family protein [bacterium]|nr:flagellar basal body-associated FliL family protein [bacterium]